MRKALLSLILSFITFTTFSQEKSIFFDDFEGLKTIKAIPNEGKLFTVQIAQHSWGKVHDRNLSIMLAHLKCGYVFKKGDNNYISVGIFNNLSDARETASQLSNLYPGAFPVAYSNGKRVNISTIENGDLDEVEVNIKKAKKEIKKVLKNSYYRIQLGYFEKEGYEPKVQANFDKIKASGFKLEEEEYKNGRRVLTVKKFKTVDQLYDAVELIESITDIYAIPKEYSTFDVKILRDYDRIYKLL